MHDLNSPQTLRCYIMELAYHQQRQFNCIDNVQFSFSPSLPLSLRFNGHFPGEPGLAGVY